MFNCNLERTSDKGKDPATKQSSNLTARPFPNWDEQEPVVLESPAILNLDPDLLFDGDVMWGCDVGM